MDKIINFDMDGTLVDLYNVPNWEEDLRKWRTEPYEKAKPLLNMSALAQLLRKAQNKGFTINIISWTSKKSTKAYSKRVETAKKEWLKKHMPSVKFDNVFIVPYGTPKESLSSGILFDDDNTIRSMWSGTALDETDIINQLKNIIK